MTSFHQLRDALDARKGDELIFAQDTTKSGSKRFFCFERATFLHIYNMDLRFMLRMQRRGRVCSLNWYEVLTGQCKFYIDIDKITMDDFFGTLSWIHRNFPMEHLRIFHCEHALDEHSFHITGTTIYDSPTHLGATLSLLQDRPHWIDMAVYTKNRCWKCPYSRKYQKSTMMIPFNLDGTDGTDGMLYEEDLVAVSHGVTRPPERPPERPQIHRVRSSGESSGESSVGSGGWKLTLAEKYGDFYDIQMMDRRFIRLSARTKQCALANRTHRNNHVYLIYDTQEKRYKQLCYSQHCRHVDSPWIDLDT